MVACESCHRAKVKCIKEDGSPCLRCARLSVECTPHQPRYRSSRRSSPDREAIKKRRTEDPATNEASAASAASHPDITTVASTNLITCDIEQHIVEVSTLRGVDPDHFGLQHLIRMWIGLSFSRRSLKLLADATTLASKIGLTMDGLFCGESQYGARMDFLKPLVSLREQEVTGPPLTYPDIPDEMRLATNTMESTPGDRWYMIRETHEGKCRFLVSPKFDQDIASWDAIDQTWRGNQREVKDLWLPKEEKMVYAHGLWQNFIAAARPGMGTQMIRVPNTKIKLRSGVTVGVHCFIVLSIAEIDRDYIHLEYILIEPINMEGAIPDNPNAQHGRTEDTDTPVDNTVLRTENFSDAGLISDDWMEIVEMLE